ncbi:hypothetical protein [Pseudoalteromonas denitrificans]|uniref:Uncharacterized protein n=1 Tax=Pseudoalteromonas denitrificans DSM 6059 TaxID=1123010 RepID=A0A1I1HTS2_9GAMM|nr:hypothetical protein [Pseudoalteromonas denitrificans]SFC25348.1 hypothetical protein SAMN02745724_01272 [Pseudoalteromonas denitrificans DSM 6059]
MKRILSLSIASLLTFSSLSASAVSNEVVIPELLNSSTISSVSADRPSLVTSTYRTSMFLNQGQRKTLWKTFSKEADYNQLAAFVAISYGDLRSVSCRISLYNGSSSQAFKQLNCGRSQQWNPTTPDVPVLNSTLRAKIELYNADFTQSSKLVNLILTPNFATTDDNDSDGLPGWFETLRNLSDSDATDADSDRDLDGYTAFEEYQAGTHPSDSNSKPL